MWVVGDDASGAHRMSLMHSLTVARVAIRPATFRRSALLLLGAASLFTACRRESAKADARSLATPQPASAPSSSAPVDSTILGSWGRSPIVFRGRVEQVLEISDDLMPEPTYSATLLLRVEEVFRGSPSRRQTQRVAYTSRTVPQLEGHCLVVGASTVEVPNRRGDRTLATNVTAGCAQLADNVLRKLVALPLGWSEREGQLVSPWAAPDDAARAAAPAVREPRAEYFCSRTGRPAWLTGPGLELHLGAVDGEDPQKPAGNGKFRIDLVNTSREAVAVPALPERNGRALWNESLLVEIGSRLFTLAAGATLSQGGLRSVRLQPGARLSTTVDLSQMLAEAASPTRGAGNVPVSVFLGDLADSTFVYLRGGGHERLGGDRAN